jgi:glycosyltransferase involved in cell wall biosynthesis
MRILYVLNSGEPGGMEQHVLDLTCGMVANKNEVYVWCKKGVISKWYENAGAEVFNKKTKFDIDPLYIHDLVKFLKEKKIDVIHAHEVKTVANAMIAGFIAKTPVRISHTHTPISEWRISPVAKTIDTFVNTLIVNLFSTKEIALTESRKKIKMKEGIMESKLEVIPNGLDFSRFNITEKNREKLRKEMRLKYKIPEDAFVFGNVSRITEEKGHKILVHAFSDLLKYPILEKEDFYLLIAGGGKLENDLKKLVRELGIADKVVVTGIFEDKDLPGFYSLFDVFVFPSLAEGFGYVLLEALYNKLPVVCSNLPVLKEVGSDEVTYFDRGSVKELADKMEEVYKRVKSKNYGVGEIKKRIAEEYSMKKFIESYLKIYSI